MKTQFLQMISALATMASATPAYTQENVMIPHTASFIEIPAALGQTVALADFLIGAAPLVEKTEPETELWIAMQAQDTLAIFDIFKDADARSAHFSGVVAGALAEHADVLVKGGWKTGVVDNISNSNVLAATPLVRFSEATTGTYIAIEAAPGRSEQLAALLTAAGPLVAETEPETLFWVALRIGESSFAIFDVFADNSGREKHFAGQVAKLLKEKSSLLVAGGWDDGVVMQIKNFDILTTMLR